MKSIYDSDYIEIITRLRAYRCQNQITQKELSLKMGVQQSFVSKVENCERRIDVIEFLSWIDSLGVSIYDILPEKYFSKGDLPV